MMMFCKGSKWTPAAVVLLSSLAIPFVVAAASGNDSANVVLTDSGRLAGVRSSDGKVVSYKGVPYAIPPVGKLRWTPPEPAASWEGVRAADHFAPSCIQREHGDMLPWTIEYLDKNQASENCLYLNVWTPNPAPAAKLPVVVFIHGGGFTEGSGAVPIYDGESLAHQGIVLVTINYRLGVFGFFAHPELTRLSAHHASGNYALMDQLAALRWVRSNIRQFGGDAQKVTIWGQSAGAASVVALLASPRSANLFHAAMADSGIGLLQKMPDLKDAEDTGQKFANALNAKSIDDLRGRPADELLKASQTGPRFGPIVDGWVLTTSPLKLNEQGGGMDVPVITGVQATDAALFSHKPDSLDQWKQQSQREFGSRTAAFDKLYPVTTLDEARAMWLQSVQDHLRVFMYLWATRCAQHHKQPVFTYFFDRPIPWPQHPEFGAFHSGELPYFFLNLQVLDRPWKPVDRSLARTASEYLKDFAATGDPNGKSLPRWAPVDSAQPSTMELGEHIGPMPVATPERLAFWGDFFKASTQ